MLVCRLPQAYAVLWGSDILREKVNPPKGVSRSAYVFRFCWIKNVCHSIEAGSDVAEQDAMLLQVQQSSWWHKSIYITFLDLRLPRPLVGSFIKKVRDCLAQLENVTNAQKPECSLYEFQQMAGWQKTSCIITALLTLLLHQIHFLASRNANIKHAILHKPMPQLNLCSQTRARAVTTDV